ncbi:MAG: endonuclease III [Candidatus Thermoplasmatota archaeon]|nr:endonuclease III [Candidatus Thermoplasmatota archaeon]
MTTRNSCQMALRKKANEVDSTLTSVYGRKSRHSNPDPLDTLVETILSQNTSDVNSHRAFGRLKERYPNWEMLLDANHSEIVSVIRSGGLADIKARSIVGALNRVMEEAGSLKLAFLSKMPTKEATEWLSSIDGIGPKTAAIVLLFSFGKLVFPVDTHVHRVSGRLGLLSPRATRESAQKELEALVPEEEYYNMHLNLIEHGRRRCKALNPLCDLCEVSRLCAYHGTSVMAQP